MERSWQDIILIFTLTFVLIITSWLTAFEAKSASQTLEKSPFTYAGPDREQKLIEGAQKEGRLTWYTTLAGQVINNIIKAFEAKYPFVKVQVFRSSEANVVQRVEQEARTRNHTVDVMEVPAGAVLVLRDDELVTPYFSPATAKLPEAYRIEAGGNMVWAGADRVSYVGFAYNKDKLSPSAVPKTLADLLKPELKKKLGISSSSVEVRWVGSVLHSLGDQEGRKFLAELKKQNVKVYTMSPGALMDLISQGELASSMIIFGEHAAQAKEKGVPVEWVPIEGTIVNVGQVIVAKQALNPNATMLFVDFILGKDGGAVLKKDKFNPAYEAGSVSFKAWAPEQGKTATKYIEDFNQWQQLLKSTFR